MRRFSIYLFTDQNGIVDNYVEYFLKDLYENSQNIAIIASYCITKEGRKIFEKYSDYILVQNDGIPFVHKLPIDIIEKYDEITFVTDAIMGPLFSMHQMFDEMGKRNTDIWGLVYNREPETGQKFIPLEFISIKTSLLGTFEYKEFLQRFPDSYFFSRKSACRFYQYFSERGYTLGSFVNDSEAFHSSDRPHILFCCQLIREKRLPIFWKNIFTEMYGDLLEESIGNAPLDMYRLIETDFPDYQTCLWQHLLRTCHMCDLVHRLHLNYVLPTKQTSSLCSQALQQYKIAILIHVYRPDVLKKYMTYLRNMPETSDCYITTDTVEKKGQIQEECINLPYRKIEIRVIQNRGRDVGSKLVGARDIMEHYDLICFVHDKKTPHLYPQTIGEGFGYKCYSNVLFSKVYVHNVIQLFFDHPFLGLAVPPEPNHGTMFTTLGYEWVGNYESTQKLAEQLRLHIPMSNTKEPVAPFGSFFWCRPRALKRLFEHKWSYEDFPEEPAADDGTILHAIERIYPYVAQQEGYYTAIVMADDYARIEFTNLRYYLRSYNKCFIKRGIINSQSNMLREINYQLDNANSG